MHFIVNLLLVAAILHTTKPAVAGEWTGPWRGPAALPGVLPAFTVAAGPEDLAKRGVNKITKKFGLGSAFGRHSDVPPLQIKDKWVYILPLSDQNGSRVTNNFDSKWDGQKRFQVFVELVDPSLRMVMSFQRKGDKKWNSDSDRGSQFRHKGLVKLDGKNNYLAERGFDWSKHKDAHPAAFVMLVEVGLSQTEVFEYFDTQAE